MKFKEIVLFEDQDLVVINKPTGITVIPDRQQKFVSLQQIAEKECGKLFIVHRIDRETSGVILFTKNEFAHRHLSMQFEKHTVGKWYAAIVKGKMTQPNGTINLPIAKHSIKANVMIVHPTGKPSISHYKVEEQFMHASLLKVNIETGRTHQVRVHLAAIGHPLLVDAVYANSTGFMVSSIKKNYKKGSDERSIMNRLTLHASELQIIHPTNNLSINFIAPFPPDFSTLLKILRRYDNT